MEGAGEIEGKEIDKSVVNRDIINDEVYLLNSATNVTNPATTKYTKYSLDLWRSACQSRIRVSQQIETEPNWGNNILHPHPPLNSIAGSPDC
jgi:hypothetical protein